MHKPEEYFVRNLKHGSLENLFAVYGMDVRVTKHGKKYAELRVGDKTGVLTARYFTDDEGEVDEIMSSYKVGEVIRIRGDLGDYGITIKQPFTASITRCWEGEYEISDFRAVTGNDVEEMLGVIKENIRGLKNPHLKELCGFFFNDENFVKAFKSIPGAQSKHHNYEGGLLEHTYEMVRLWYVVCDLHKELDKDLLFCGIIFHDLGKLRSYAFKGASIERTTEEEMIGHIVLGEGMIRDAMDKIDGFPEELKSKLSHLILSHHGEIREGYGSAVSPKLPEAYVLFYLDYAGSQINLVMQRYGGLERG